MGRLCPAGSDCVALHLAEHGCWLGSEPVPPAVLESLAALTSYLPRDVGDRWVSTAVLAEHGPRGRLDLDAAIIEALGPDLERLLPNHEPFMASMFTKGSGAPAVPFHQDPTYTDEDLGVRSCVAWIPLTPVDEVNGALTLVRESHRWAKGVRALGVGGFQPLDPDAAVLEALAVTAAMPAGAVLLFDVATAHGSHPNRSAEGRPAVAVNLAPRDRRHWICHRRSPTMLDRFEIGADYLAEPNPFRGRPTAHELIETIEAPRPTFDIPDSVRAVMATSR